MNTETIIGLLQAKLKNLETNYTLSTSSGNIEEIIKIEEEIKEVKKTIEDLKSLN